VSEVTILVRVTVDDAQVAKTNAKRARLGKQSRTGTEEIINRVGEALQHNTMFEQPIDIRVMPKLVWECRICGFAVREGEDLEYMRRNGSHTSQNNGTAYCPLCYDETLRPA